MTQHDGRLPQIRACPSSREYDLDASEEVEVIKAILQREGYMDRARSQIASPGSQFSKNQGALDDLITTLDLLRSATLDTVEATAQWRTAQGHTNPFIWGGMNYLLKIPTDLNFLDEYKVQVSYRYLLLVFALMILLVYFLVSEHFYSKAATMRYYCLLFSGIADPPPVHWPSRRPPSTCTSYAR